MQNPKEDRENRFSHEHCNGEHKGVGPGMLSLSEMNK